MTSPANAPACEQHLAARLEDQAAHARRGEITALDLDDIAEQPGGMARSDRREIQIRLRVLIAHLLKCWIRPDGRSSSSLATILEQRQHLLVPIENSCSPRGYAAEMLDRTYPAARSKAVAEMRLRESAFPGSCPSSIEEVHDARLFPGTGSRLRR